MQKHDFYFDLPEELIAQVPIENRSASKLMVIDKEKQTIKSTFFTKIKELLQKGDVLVLNDTKVILARLFGIKEGTGAKIEILLLKEIKKDRWQALVGNAKAVKLDSVVNISDKIWAKCVEVLENGLRVFELSYHGTFYEDLDTVGNITLPPYIHAK